LADKLLSDHPGNLDARLVAAGLRAEIDCDRADAYRVVVESESLAKSEVEILSLVSAANQVAQWAGDKLEAAALLLATNKLGVGHPQVGTLEARRLLSEDKVEEAGVRLESCRNELDAVWLQIAARVAERKQDWISASSFWSRAAELLPYPNVLKACATAAFRADDLEVAERSLLTILARSPEDDVTHFNLGVVLAKAGKPGASTQMRRAWELDGTQSVYVKELARTLVLDGRHSEAAEALRTHMDRSGESAEFVVMEADILALGGHVEKAFALMMSHKPEFEQDPAYLGRLMSLGFESGHESEAYDALMGLRQLEYRPP